MESSGVRVSSRGPPPGSKAKAFTASFLRSAASCSSCHRSCRGQTLHRPHSSTRPRTKPEKSVEASEKQGRLLGKQDTQSAGLVSTAWSSSGGLGPNPPPLPTDWHRTAKTAHMLAVAGKSGGRGSCGLHFYGVFALPTPSQPGVGRTAQSCVHAGGGRVK